MSTRTDWGYLRRDGSRLEPVAVGDAWHDWVCPNRKWVYGETYIHPYSGEECETEPYLESACRMKSAGPKREECPRCDVIFIYP